MVHTEVYKDRYKIYVTFLLSEYFYDVSFRYYLIYHLFYKKYIPQIKFMFLLITKNEYFLY